MRTTGKVLVFSTVRSRARNSDHEIVSNCVQRVCAAVDDELCRFPSGAGEQPPPAAEIDDDARRVDHGPSTRRPATRTGRCRRRGRDRRSDRAARPAVSRMFTIDAGSRTGGSGCRTPESADAPSGRARAENEESPGRQLPAEAERTVRGSQADTSTIGRSAGVSLRLDLIHRPSRRPEGLRGGRCRFSESRAGLPARCPSSPFTLTRFPVSPKWCRSRAVLLGSSWGGPDSSDSLRSEPSPRSPVDPSRTGGFSVLCPDSAVPFPVAGSDVRSSERCPL